MKNPFRKDIVFHKSYLDRIPKRYFPTFQGSFPFGDVVIPLVVIRNLQATKYFWKFEFLHRSFVFWTESYGNDYMSKFSDIMRQYVSAFFDELKKNDKKCSVLIQDPSPLYLTF